MKEQLKLYQVTYCDRETLEMENTIKTHSKKMAERFAKYLKTQKNVLYSQVITYTYNEYVELYEFTTLHNYHKQ